MESSQNAVSIIWWREGGRLMIYVVDAKIINSLFYGREQVKLPGGGAKDGESPEGAAIRELEEETGLKVKRRRRVRLILSERVGSHTKHAFLISRYACKGRPREKKLWDNDSILSPPRPISLEEALDVILCPKSNTFNRDALMEAKRIIEEEGL